MINIDDLYYNCEVNVRQVNIRGDFEDIVILKTQDKFENISLIKTKDSIYKIGDIFKWFEEDNIYWLELIGVSENLEAQRLDQLTKDNERMKAALEKLLGDKLDNE